MGKALEVIHPFAAGIDIGSQSFFVDAGEDQVKIFPSYTEGCNALRDYLVEHKIRTVAMESTGVYWVILYSILEESGIDVFLVNGRDVKNVPGRKSDIKDCQWLRQLHSYGLLKKSFIPDGSIREMRSYVRLRQDHIRAAATQINLMQKALTLMNIRLTEVIDDVSGVSGRRMINSILKGERDPQVLVELCDISIKKKKRELVVKALEGKYQPEHLFALEQACRTHDYYQTLIGECDEQIEKLLGKLTPDKAEIAIQAKRKDIRYNKPQIKDLYKPLLSLSQGKDPTAIPGITDYTFLQIISEIGVDMAAWKDEKHFVSWLKLCPLKNTSGKSSRRISFKRGNKASQLFRQIAQGMLASKYLALGSFARRIRAARGSAVAIKAVARKIACYYYRVMTKGEAFVEKGIQAYEEKLKEQKLRYLEKMATKLNYELVKIE